jgi:hypothetical protein
MAVQYSPWCEVPGRTTLKEMGEDAASLDARVHRLLDEAIIALSGKKATRAEVVATGVEAAFRGLLPAGEQRRLARMLQDDVAALVEQRDRASWRRAFPYLSAAELAALRAGGGR